MEQDTRTRDLEAEAVTPFASPVSIHLHSKRKRLVDIDGISGKAVIDGIVHTGLLEDDNYDWVKEVTYTQEKTAKGEEEETIITITEILNE